MKGTGGGAVFDSQFDQALAWAAGSGFKVACYGAAIGGGGGQVLP